MPAATYRWNAQATGGFWAVADNWSNLTTGETPSPTAPGTADTAIVDGQPPDQFQIVAGPGQANGLGLLDDTAFQGAIAAGVLVTGQGLLGATDVLTGATLSVAGDATDAGNLEVNGQGAILAVGGALTQADSNAAGGDVLVLNGAVAQAGAWEVAGTVTVDPTAAATVGPAGGAGTIPIGVLSIQPGATLTLDPLAIIEESIVDNGILATQATGASALDVTVKGNISGDGQMSVDGKNILTVNGSISGLGSIALADAIAATSASSMVVDDGLAATGPISVGAYDSLFVDGPVANTGAITLGTGATASFGLGAMTNPGAIAVGAGATATFGDNLTGSSTMTIATGGKVEIDANLSGLSGVTLASGAELDFARTSTSVGTDVNVPIGLGGDDLLDVAAGVAIAGAVAGFDDSDVIRYQSAGLEYGGAMVTGAAWSTADNTVRLTVDGALTSSILLAGDYAGQQFLTVGVGEGLTDGDTLIGLASGNVALPAGGTVAGGSGNSFQLLTGTASAASFSFTGNNALLGRVSTSSVTVGGTVANTLNTLLIEAGAALAASGTAAIETALEADGAGASFTVAGALTLGGSDALPELAAVNGAAVQVGGLDVTGNTVSQAGFGALVFVDPAGSIEVGAAGGAAAGAVTIDAGASLTSQTASATIIGAVIDNGTLEVAAATDPTMGSSLNIYGSLSGTGSVLIDPQLALTVNGDLTGVSDIGVGASSSMTIRGNLVSAVVLETGDSSSVSVVGAMENLQSITTGNAASLTLSGPVSGVGTIDIGVSGRAEFGAALSGAGTGALQLGSQANATITGIVSGFSGITLGSGADLTLNGGDQSVGITLTGSNLLTLGAGVPVSGAISGFDVTDDLLNVGGPPITAATYSPTSGGGTLTLWNDGTVVDTLTLAGSYANDFLTNAVPFFTNAIGLASGQTSITLPGSVQSGLSDPTVTGGTGFTFDVLAGTGSAAGALTLLANLAVEGSFSGGSIVIGNDFEAIQAPTPSAVDIQAGASLTTAGSATVLTNAEIDGSGALLSAGALTLVGGNGSSEIMLVDGGRVQATSLTLTPSDNPFGLGIATIAVDPTSIMQVGSGAGSTVGAVNIAAGAAVTAVGPLDYISGQVVDDGTLDVGTSSSGSSSLELYNSLSGSGQVTVTAGNGHGLNLDNGASGLSGFSVGAGASVYVAGTLTNIGTITTGQSSSVIVTNNTTTPGDVTGVGSISEGAQASLTIIGNLSGAGPLEIGAGATAEIDGNVSGLSGITLDAGASLTLLGGDVSVPVQMGADATLTIGYGTVITGTISGFGFGDVIKVEGVAYGIYVTGATPTPTAGGLNALQLTDDATLLNTLMLSGNFAGHAFISNAAGAGGTSDIVVADLPCFAAGTRIATARGEIAVEALAIGDPVVTATGQAMPITWIGRRRIDFTRHPHPARVAPIRIRRGAISDGVPCRDLLVSPDHAILIDDVLVCARMLVNGASIVRESALAEITYFHVELDRHAVLFAEGLTAESYLDTGNRGIFVDAGAPMVLHPDVPGVAGQALREAGSCAPFVDDPDVIRPIWQRLADRADALGLAPLLVPTTDEPNLALLANGRLLRPVWVSEGRHIFCLPPGAISLRLVSRAAAPSAIRSWSADDRLLGVAVTRIMLRDQANLQPIPMDHPSLADGWWGVESNGAMTWRWTNGNAKLPPPATDQACLMEIRTLGGGTFLLDDAATERVAA